MHSLLVPSLTLGGLIPAVRAIAYPGPAVTHVDRILEGVFPNPTPAPAIDISELRRRQNDAGDNTCGWQDNGLALTCGVSRTCMKYLPDNSVGMAGCCTAGDYQDCGWSNQCLNSWDAQESCGSACYSNTFIRKCTASSAPFCVSWTYPFEQIQDYGCSDEPIDSWITISASSSGASSGRVSLPVAPESSVTGWRSEDNPSSQCSSSSSCGTPTPPPSPDDDDDTPVGAIVGGVVGGIGAIALVCLGVWLCLRHKKKQRTAAAGQQSGPGPHMPQVPGPAPQPQGPSMEHYGQPGYAPLPQQPGGYFDPAAPPQQLQQPGATTSYYGGAGAGDNKFGNGGAAGGGFPSTPGSPAPPYAQINQPQGFALDPKAPHEGAYEIGGEATQASGAGSPQPQQQQQQPYQQSGQHVYEVQG